MSEDTTFCFFCNNPVKSCEHLDSEQMKKFNDFLDWFNSWGDHDSHSECAIDNIRQPFGNGYDEAISDSMDRLVEIFDLPVDWIQERLKSKEKKRI